MQCFNESITIEENSGIENNGSHRTKVIVIKYGASDSKVLYFSDTGIVDKNVNLAVFGRNGN